ncbi:MAG: 5'/3'-nucleotidase SurE [Acidimicrobiales bacterium]
MCVRTATWRRPCHPCGRRAAWTCPSREELLSWDSSGASASLTAVEQDGRLPVRELAYEPVPGVVAYAVDAPPAIIVRTAMQGAFGVVPDIVLSGVNLGVNTGHAVVHSGTVGATLTASNDDRSAMAVSLELRDEAHWETAHHVAVVVLRWLVEQPPPLILNVNVPNRPLDRLEGVRPARLAPFGAVQTNITEIGKGYVRVEYADVDATPASDTGVAMLKSGYASVTALAGVCERTDVDITSLALVPS